MVTKLDRMARSATEGTKVIKEMMERNICVQVLNMGKMDDTSMGKSLCWIMYAFICTI